MVLTKSQALAFLNQVKKRQGKGSGKYYAVGFCRILVRKDIVTVEDIIHEFPEADQPEQQIQQQQEKTSTSTSKAITRTRTRNNPKEESKY